MRVSTTQFYTQSYSAIQDNQSAVMKLQEQITSGKKVNRPSDDPAATTQINLLNKTVNTLAQFKKNGDYASSQLSLEETQLNSVVNITQRVRELSVQMTNDTFNAGDRKDAAKEVNQLISQMANIMNTKNSEGELVFAGNSVNATAAFIPDTANSGSLQSGNYYAYLGSTNAGGSQDQQANYGARFVQIGFDSDNKVSPNDAGDASRVRITDNGASVFNIPGAASLPAAVDKSLINVMVELRDNLEQGKAPPVAVTDDLSLGIKQMSTQLAEIGGRQNRITSQSNAGDTFTIALQQRLSNLQDLDMAQGVTDLTTKQTSLQIAQQVFAKVQGMSLFNYIK